jgi:hypothetical protein
VSATKDPGSAPRLPVPLTNERPNVRYSGRRASDFVGRPLQERRQARPEFLAVRGERVLAARRNFVVLGARNQRTASSNSSRRFESVDVLAAGTCASMSTNRSDSWAPMMLTICIAYCPLSVSMTPEGGQ